MEEMLNKIPPLTFSVAGKEIEINRPEAIISNIDVVPYDRGMDPQIAIEALAEGYSVLIVDFYSSGLILLKELKEYVKSKYPNQTFQEQREFRNVYREFSHHLLLVVRDHELVVKKAPEIGWLQILYPDQEEFLLAFPQVQGLNSAWQWFKKGISTPVLSQKIFPWYGTYFPTRFEHLKLFDKWLKKYKGEKKSAMDIGIGCGVLSLQLLKHGFEKVYGTDTNPNAIFGLQQAQLKNKRYSKIDLIFGDLFAGLDAKTELIVFNPPWLPAPYQAQGLDKAIYYNADLFPRFFADATKHLENDGRVVLLFSNLAQITKAEGIHPIEKEIADGGRFEKEVFIQKEVNPASKKTKRNQHWRADEKVELWVLKKVNHRNKK